jgi:hypothetical protein
LALTIYGAFSSSIKSPFVLLFQLLANNHSSCLTAEIPSGFSVSSINFQINFVDSQTTAFDGTVNWNFRFWFVLGTPLPVKTKVRIIIKRDRTSLALGGAYFAMA